MNILLPAPPATKLKPAIPPASVTSGQVHSSHATIMVWSQLQNFGERMLVDQSNLGVQWLCCDICETKLFGTWERMCDIWETHVT